MQLSGNYHMPAEWETHSATQLHWPSNRETWAQRLQRVENVYLEIIEVLHRYEPVILLADEQCNLKRVENMLKDRIHTPSNIQIYQLPLNDVWARDCGPVFIKKRGKTEFAIIDWEYNAWGGKYPPFGDDNNLPAWFGKQFSLPVFKPGMVLEGGSIDVNGEGLLLTTESVLLNPNRNPVLSKEEIEKKLSDYLGAEKIIWLKKGLAGDDTDGHIDDLSRFLNRNTVLTMLCEDPEDINHAALQENYEILCRSEDTRGEPLHIITLPLPKTRIDGTTVDGSEYVPASYANFYIANGVVLVPLYDENYDEEALQLFREFFPEREVVGIECSDLVWGQGSIHCVTQQLYGIGF
ncbi:MAG: agmatine deiminase family protein [Balneolaceae bacterium]